MNKYLINNMIKAINKYGFYHTGMKVNHKKIAKHGIIDVAEIYDLDLQLAGDRITANAIMYLHNEKDKTVYEIKQSNAHKTFPPAFKSLHELGIDL